MTPNNPKNKRKNMKNKELTKLSSNLSIKNTTETKSFPTIRPKTSNKTRAPYPSSKDRSKTRKKKQERLSQNLNTVRELSVVDYCDKWTDLAILYDNKQCKRPSSLKCPNKTPKPFSWQTVWNPNTNRTIRPATVTIASVSIRSSKVHLL